LERQRERELAAGKKSEIQIWKDYAEELGDLGAELFHHFGSVTKAYSDSFTNILKSNEYFKKEFKKSGYETWENYSKAIR
jgi:hypothetical protein